MFDYGDLIGIPFEFGGRGPDVYDCWGLQMELVRRWSGAELPDYRSPEVLEEIAMMMAADKYLWTPFAEREADGSPVPFSALQPGRSILIQVKGLACHVGFIHRPHYFLHTWKGTGGVTAEPIELWRKRILGVYGFG